METTRCRAAWWLQGLTVLCFGAAQAVGAPADPPYPVDIFVRGSFNGWDLGHPMKYDARAGRYTAVVELAPGYAHLFKIASADWSSVDLGAADDGVVELGVPEPMANVPFTNLAVTVPEAGVYSFTLDPTDPQQPTLTVAYSRAGGDGTQHFQGTFDGGPWYFDCIGQTVWAVFVVKANLHERVNPGGGLLYSENLQTDGHAWDSAGQRYALHAARIFRYAEPPSGGLQFYSSSKIRLVAQGAAPDLWVEMRYRLHVDADGNLVREFYFDGLGCTP